MKIYFISVLLFILITSSLQFYNESSDKVSVLTTSNYTDKTKSGLWLIEFYAPWCGHCKSLKPHWTKAAQALEGLGINVGACDMDSNKVNVEIQGYPTIKAFIDGKEIEEYEGSRSAEGIVDWGFGLLEKTALKRIGVDAGSSYSNNNSNANNNRGGGGSCGGVNRQHNNNQGSCGGGNQRQNNNNQGSCGGGNNGSNNNNSGVKLTTLTDSNFDELVYTPGSNKLWLIVFSLSQCSPCRNQENIISQAAKDLKDNENIKFGTIDVIAQKGLAAKFPGDAFPHLKFISSNKEINKTHDLFKSKSEVKSKVNSLLEEFSDNNNIKQLTSKSQLVELTKAEDSYTVLVFLPNLEKISSIEKEEYFEEINEAMKIDYPKTVKFVYLQEGDFKVLEQTFFEMDDYPTVVTIENKEKLFSVMSTSFNEENIKNAVLDSMENRAIKMTLGELPQF